MQIDQFGLKDLSDPQKYHDDIDISHYPTEWYLEALKTMLTIRKTEEIIGDNVENGMIQCPCHLSIGQEAIPTGISTFLTKNDFVFGNHRSHGHYLALNHDVHSLLAEVLGKVTGCSKGMGGSMHILDINSGFIGSVPIVSATIPVAVGAALSAKLRKTNAIAVSYFGDGTTEEGTFHESLNIASYYRLPILFVCENNLFSSHLHIKERQPSDSVARFAQAHNIDFDVIDGNNINTIFQVAEKAVKSLRNGNGPHFIEAITYRWRGHVGPDENIDVGLRRKEDLYKWKKRDPIGRLLNGLIKRKIITDNEYQKLLKNIAMLVNNAWEQAVGDPYPEQSQLLDSVYYRDNVLI